ncbi:MAG: Crp/Fnr family transcriptional regulator [Halioglobus sp.]|nr:Crp/Fnr family transcriptional regulator [Halioglobus sp.]
MPESDSPGELVLPEIVAAAKTAAFAANGCLFRQGDSCENYLVLKSGSIKVFARSPGGKEILLYRVLPGDICVLTTSCLLSGSRYPAEALTETDVSAAVIPRADFERHLRESEEFRTFVLSSYGERIADLIALVEQVALASIEQRLVQYLLQYAGTDGRVSATHQDIATEIGSVREVVSRHLRAFSERGWIDTGRGSIRLLDISALQDLAGEAQ